MIKWNEEYKVYVSDDGRIWNKDGHLYSQQISQGYYRVYVRYRNKVRKHWLVHILVYETFKGKVPPGLQVDHKDRNKLNNEIDNLRAVTVSVNNRNRILPKFKGKSMVFGKKFYDHYHKTKRTDLRLYNKEYHYWRYYGKCSWE